MIPKDHVIAQYSSRVVFLELFTLQSSMKHERPALRELESKRAISGEITSPRRSLIKRPSHRCNRSGIVSPDE